MTHTRTVAIAAMCITARLVLGLDTVSAQVNTGTVLGTVKDAQGGVIPGATVTLISEARGTRSAPVVTNENGDFVFANVTADTYTVEVALESFKTVAALGHRGQPRRTRWPVGTLSLEVGGAAETVVVKGEAPQVQSSSGERSFSVTTAEVTNLPIATRNFADLINLTPGVVNGNRAGDSASTGGGSNNFMMDGVSTMEPGSNRLMVAVNVESIAEVKVLTSSYQAEYGRSSGLQVTAVTKSGSNRFSGSLYDVERNSDWYANSQTNILNGDPKTTLKQRDWGYSIGGPVGKPGGNNKLFFFYAQEFQPRTTGNDVVRFRVPTALERQGDFSQTIDNNGNPFPYIKDPLLSGTCSATSQAACFADGGVLGRIPANRLYQTGQNILNLYPLPNIANVPAGQNYNYELTRPEQSLTSWQPVVRIDYQPFTALRGTFKYAVVGSAERRHSRVHSRIQRHADERSGRAALVGHPELHPQLHHVRRGELRARLAPAGGLRSQRRRRQLLHGGLPGEPGRQPATNGLSGLPTPVPRRQHRRSELLQVRRPHRGEPGELRRHAGAPAAGVPVGRPGATQRAAEQRLSRLRRLLGGQGLRGQRHQGLGPAYYQDRLLQAVGRQAAEPGQPVRHAEFRQRRQQPARLRVRVSPTRRSASSAPTTRRRGSSRGSTTTPTTRPTSRTTGRSPTG